MGTWETGLYSNDLALDVRDDYREMLVFHYSHEEAVKRLVQEYELSEDDPYNAAGWFALADCAWKYGYLDEGLKQLVQRLYEEEAEKELWADSPRDWKKRKTVIAKLLERIQVPRKKPAKPSMPYLPRPYYVGWHIGDMLAFQLQDGPYCGNYIAILIVASHSIPISRFAPPTEVYVCYEFVITTYNQKRIPNVTDFQDSISIYHDTKRLERERSLFKGKMKKSQPEDGDYEARARTSTMELNKKIERLFTVIGRIDAATVQKIQHDTQVTFFGGITPLLWGKNFLPLFEQNDVLVYRRDGGEQI